MRFGGRHEHADGQGSDPVLGSGVYELAPTGTVEEYVRVVIDDLGGATGFTAALCAVRGWRYPVGRLSRCRAQQPRKMSG